MNALLLLLLSLLPTATRADSAFLRGIQVLSKKADSANHEYSAVYTQYSGAEKTAVYWSSPLEGNAFNAQIPHLTEAEFRARVSETRARSILLCIFHTHPANWPQEISKLDKEEIKSRGWEEYLRFLPTGMKSIPPGGGDSMVELGYAQSMEELMPGIKARDQLGVIDASGVWYYSHYKAAEQSSAERIFLASLQKDSELAAKAKAMQRFSNPLDLLDAVRKPWMLHVNRAEVSLEATLASPWYAFLRYGYAKAGIRLDFVSRSRVSNSAPCTP